MGDPTKFTVAVSDCQLGKQLGNTMSVCVLERLFTRLLPAAKLVRGGLVKDRWENGQAVKKLAATRGQGFKGMSAKEKKAYAKGVFAIDASPAGPKRRSASNSAGGAAKRQR